MTKPSVYHSQGYNCAEALIKSYNEEHNTNEARGYARELMSKVREKYDSEICAVLKKNKVSCAEIIDFSYEALNEVLDK